MKELIRNYKIDDLFIEELSGENPDVDRLKGLIRLGADVNSLSLDTGYSCIMDYIYTIPEKWEEKMPKLEIIKFLIDEGADLNYTTEDGFSLMHCYDLSPVKDDDLLELLLKSGANPNFIYLEQGTLMNSVSDSPIEEYYSESAIKILKNYGAKYAFELKTREIKKYLNYYISPKQELNFYTLTGFMNPADVPGVNPEEVEELIRLCSSFPENKEINLEKDDIGPLVAFNNKRLEMAKKIKALLGRNITVYVTYFDIEYTYFFNKTLRVDTETEISEYAYMKRRLSDGRYLVSPF